MPYKSIFVESYGKVIKMFDSSMGRRQSIRAYEIAGRDVFQKEDDKMEKIWETHLHSMERLMLKH